METNGIRTVCQEFMLRFLPEMSHIPGLKPSNMTLSQPASVVNQTLPPCLFT